MHRVLPALLCLALIGCGTRDEPVVPAGCLAGVDQVRSALQDAPKPVRVDGAKLSECLKPGASGSQIQQVGTILITVSQQLADAAAQDPAAALQLGYLNGAAEQGAAKTGGFHAELIRRLRSEAGDLPATSVEYRRGLRAGRREG